MAAVMSDFILGQSTSDAETYRLLGTSDQLEVALRHISAFVYEKRTGDSYGASQIRATVAPGSGTDVAPGWLINDVTLASRMEHRRSEQVAAETRRRKGNPKGGPKGDGKGKKGKDTTQADY